MLLKKNEPYNSEIFRKANRPCVKSLLRKMAYTFFNDRGLGNGTDYCIESNLDFTCFYIILVLPNRR